MATEIERLQALVTGGFATQQDQQRLRELIAQQANGQQQAQPPVQHPQQTVAASRFPENTPDEVIEADVNEQAFERGWGNTDVAPDRDGLFPGVCTGATYLAEQDMLVLRFKALDGAATYWEGGYINAKISAGLNSKGQAQGGAGRVKDALTALGVQYTVQNGRLRFSGHVGRPCQVLWQMIDNKGTKERRIQDVKRASAQGGSAL